MVRIFGKKMRMTQVWQNDVVKAVTPVLVSKESEDVIAELKVGDLVRVTGTSRGRGFQGVVKRHGFHGGPKSHGQKDRLRAPGSLGPTAPQRVIKGRKMAGHMGQRRFTVRNLKIIDVKSEDRQVLLLGAVPGAPESKVVISFGK